MCDLSKYKNGGNYLTMSDAIEIQAIKQQPRVPAEHTFMNVKYL